MEIVGTYTAKLPDGSITTLTVASGGAITGSNIPEGNRHSGGISYRPIRSTWRIIDPFMTPSGHWSIEFDGFFFSIYRSGTKLFLRHPYDVTHAKTAIYAKP